MNIFFAPHISGKNCVLDEQESRHCIRVLRHVQSDTITLVDGTGGLYTGVITDPNPKKCRVEIIRTTKDFEKRGYRLHVAIAPPKSVDRFEWFLEKAVEIGIDEITPLLCEHSERRKLNTGRLEKIIVSAMKQSLKAYMPVLNNLTNFETFCKKAFKGGKYIAHCNKNEKLFLKNELGSGSDSVVLIGPEGDFSPVEIEMATANGYREISLGNSRLRTETAGVVTCTMAAMVNTKEDD